MQLTIVDEWILLSVDTALKCVPKVSNRIDVRGL